MFLKDPYVVICMLLAENKNHTIQELYNHIVEKEIQISLPNFYKIIAKMINDQIITKKSGKLQLHSIRIQYILNIYDSIHHNYLENTSIDINKIKIGETKTYTVSTLYDIDYLWADIAGELAIKYPQKDCFYYNSHPYSFLAVPERDKENLAILNKKMGNTYILIGNTTFLDIYGSNMFQMLGYNVICNQNPPFPEEGYCINIIGDYIIEIIFPEIIAQYFKIFFDTTTNSTDFNTEMFTNIFKMKSLFSLKIIHSPEHAKRMSGKIKKYFI